MRDLIKLLFIIVLVLNLNVFAQDSPKDLTPTLSQITYETPDGGPQHFTGTIPQEKINRVNTLSAQLDAARNAGDAQTAQTIQREIDNLSGTVIPYYTNPGPQATCTIINSEIPIKDANFGILNNSYGFWSTATSTDRITGRMYVLGTAYNSAGSDTIFIYTSLNGISWSLLSKIQFSVAGVHYRGDELSCVAVNDGTNSYIYYSAGFDYNSTKYAAIGRLRSDGTMFFSGYPYASSATNKYYFPRITSDNIRFTTATYIYYVMTHDSTNGTTKDIYVKFGRITNPFVTTPTYGSYTTGAYFGWFYSGRADSTVAYSDIAYNDSAGYNRLISVTNFYHAGVYTNLYLAYSNDLGSTPPTYIPQIVETHVNYIPRIAFDQLGGLTGAIAYTRLFSGNDWDSFMQYTSNQGSSWTGAYIEGSTDTTFRADIVAIKGATGSFRTATSNYFGASGNVFARSVYISPTNVLTEGTLFKANPFLATHGFAPARAGYHYGADSCFTAWTGSPSGSGLYYTVGCTGAFTGIANQNSTPKVYKLEQNYPNPFNPSTTIRYSIPKNGFVNLKVYDVTGKEVATLVNEVKTPGNYIVDFDASFLSSGIYFYKIAAGDFSSVKKMILIK